MPKEPPWSKQISNTTICWGFWLIGFLNAFLAVFALIVVLKSFFFYKGGKYYYLYIFLTLFSSILGFINAWALFLVCNRGINAEGFKGHMQKGDMQKKRKKSDD